jgi:hypothetical protein
MGLLYSKTIGETESMSGSVISYSAHFNTLKTRHSKPWWRRKLLQCLDGGRMARARREREQRHLPSHVGDAMYDDGALGGVDEGLAGAYELPGFGAHDYSDDAPPGPVEIPSVLSTNMVYLEGSPVLAAAKGSGRRDSIPDVSI